MQTSKLSETDPEQASPVFQALLSGCDMGAGINAAGADIRIFRDKRTPVAAEVHLEAKALGKGFCPKKIGAGTACAEGVGTSGSVSTRCLGVKKSVENEPLVLL